jgi:cytochrome P460
MKAIRVVSALAVVLTALPLPAHPGSLSVLPEKLAGYKTWRRLLDDFQGVPMDLWLRCMAPTAADWEGARRRSGPHTERFIMVYANPLAAAFLKQGVTRPLPPGAILAKEKRKLMSGAEVDAGVAFMVKRAEPEFRDSGGWEFLYYPAVGDARQTHRHCAACHRAAASTDYVVGSYARQGAGAPGR